VVRQTVERFTDAFNRGDLAQLDQLVSKQYFSWYSTNAPGERLNAAAYDRTTLIAYFAARHQQHERLDLEFLDVQFISAERAGFTFRLTRSSDDGLRPTTYEGKGELECAVRPIGLAVWSMAPALWWPPYELLPEIGVVALIVAALGGFFFWRLRSGRLWEHDTLIKQ
jgi:hypothetical protein